MQFLNKIFFLSLVYVCTQETLGVSKDRLVVDKIFGYENEMPITEEQDESPHPTKNETDILSNLRPEELAAAQAACWNLIKEQSGKF